MMLNSLTAQLRTAWAAVPVIFRWNGGTLVLVGVVLAAVHATSTGPVESRADWTPTPVDHEFAPLTNVKLFASQPATQPAERNLFSLDGLGKAGPTRSTGADDAGFWNDVASPLKFKPARGGTR